MRRAATTRWALTLALLLAATPASARILLHEGRHRGYIRLVLDLPRGASAGLAPDGTLRARDAAGKTLTLTAPGSWAPLAAYAQGQALRVAIPAGANIHAWRLGLRYVFDISPHPVALPLPPAPSPPPPSPPRPASPSHRSLPLPPIPVAAPAPPRPPLPPTPRHPQTAAARAASHVATLQQTPQAPVTTPPTATASTATPTAPAPTAQAAKPTPAATAATVAVAPIPVAPTPAVAAAPVAAVATTSLAAARQDIALPYAASVPIAAFRRAGHRLLVVADLAAPPAALLARLHATATPLPAGMLLTLPPRLAPVAEGGAWHLLAATASPPTASPSTAASLTPKASNGVVMLPVAAPGPVLSLRDPLHGGLLLVGTVTAAGGGAPAAVTAPWRTPFFTLLPTAAGVAVAAHADAVQLRAIAGGFRLDGGAIALPLGRYDAAAAATRRVRLLNLPNLPLATLRRRLTEATLAAATAAPLARGAARLRAAQAMLALGMAAEARGVLHLAANADARLAAAPRFRLALAASRALHPEPSPHAPGHRAALSTAPCAAANELCLWRAVGLAGHPQDRALAAGMFAATLPILESYPAPLRTRLLPLAADAMLKSGNLAAANQLLAAFPHARSLRLARVMARAAALPPASAGIGGRTPAARALDSVLAAYDRLARSPDRLLAFRAAFRAARLRAARGLATPAATARALGMLRDAWRGDRRARKLREALAQARAQAGEWGRALALLRRQKHDPGIKQKLASMFARAMAADATHPMPPLKFVALVQSNPDLLPPGAPGETILSRLASRLVALDLPDQAARVYARMLRTMPPGIPRATVGARLAAQRLAAGDAKGARAALDASAVVGPLPPALLQRRTLLFARAAARLGEMPAAGAALAALGTLPALAERARLLERAGDWPAASVALRAYAAVTVPRAGKLDAAAAAILIRLATAAGRAGRATLLAALRAHDLARMPPGHAADLFRMLTDPAAVSAADLPRLAQTWGLPHGIAPELRAAGAQLVAPAIH